MYYSTKSLFHFGIIQRGETNVFSQLHSFCILDLVQTQLGIITMRFNFYAALAIIKLHKQGCLFFPFLSFFFF